MPSAAAKVDRETFHKVSRPKSRRRVGVPLHRTPGLLQVSWHRCLSRSYYSSSFAQVQLEWAYPLLWSDKHR